MAELNDRVEYFDIHVLPALKERARLLGHIDTVTADDMRSMAKCV